jgi:hypothetical protein
VRARESDTSWQFNSGRESEISIEYPECLERGDVQTRGNVHGSCAHIRAAEQGGPGKPVPVKTTAALALAAQRKVPVNLRWGYVLYKITLILNI